MKRALRWTYTLAAVASATLCAATLLLWAGSYRVTRFVGWSGPVPWFGALSMAGEIRLERGDFAILPRGWSFDRYPTSAGSPSGLWGEIAARDRGGGPLQRLGFAWARVDYGPGESRLALYVPHWSLAAALALIPALRLRSALSRRRRPAGACRACGYDLRATPETGGALLDRCPECGSVRLRAPP